MVACAVSWPHMNQTSLACISKCSFVRTSRSTLHTSIKRKIWISATKENKEIKTKNGPESLQGTEEDSTPRIPEKKLGWSFFPKEESSDEGTDDGTASEENDSDEDDVRVAYELISPSTSEYEELPPVSQAQILTACTTVSLTILVMGFALRGYAENFPDVMGNDRSLIDSLLNVNPHLQTDELLTVLVIAAFVTLARKGLMSVWPEFALATNRSNRQVLPQLDTFGILVVSALPGFTEEFFFRSALIPALYPDWRGVLIAGAAFGILHNTGGKNLGFSLWASSIGTLYGFAFLATQNMYVPMLAHSLTNLSSAYLWLNENSGSEDS